MDSYSGQPSFNGLSFICFYYISAISISYKVLSTTVFFIENASQKFFFCESFLQLEPFQIFINLVLQPFQAAGSCIVLQIRTHSKPQNAFCAKLYVRLQICYASIISYSLPGCKQFFPAESFCYNKNLGSRTPVPQKSAVRIMVSRKGRKNNGQTRRKHLQTKGWSL